MEEGEEEGEGRDFAKVKIAGKKMGKKDFKERGGNSFRLFFGLTRRIEYGGWSLCNDIEWGWNDRMKFLDLVIGIMAVSVR